VKNKHRCHEHASYVDSRRRCVLHDKPLNDVDSMYCSLLCRAETLKMTKFTSISASGRAESDMETDYTTVSEQSYAVHKRLLKSYMTVQSTDASSDVAFITAETKQNEMHSA